MKYSRVAAGHTVVARSVSQPSDALAAWLSEGVVLVTGTTPELSASTGAMKLRLRVDGVSVDVPALTSVEVSHTTGSPQRWIGVAVLPPGRVLMAEQNIVELEWGELLAPAGHATIHVSKLESIVRAALAPLDRGERTHLLDFLSRTLSHRPSKRLAQRLFQLRGALRERVPRRSIHTSTRRSLHVEAMYRVDATSIYIRGWLYDEEVDIVRLTAISPEGRRVELRQSLVAMSRPDVNAFFHLRDAIPSLLGFACLVELGAPSILEDGWIVEMVNAYGEELEVLCPAVATDPTVVRDDLLRELTPQRGAIREQLLREHISPALGRIQKVLSSSPSFSEVEQFGPAVRDPIVSVIIPLYRRLDMVESQFAEFARDAELLRVDLIYVLDSPEHADAFHDLMDQLHLVYRIPFRAAILQSNVGYSAANNAGVSLARGRLLVLLNSDVLPDAPGWISRLQMIYDTTPKAGVIGPKLLYEDGTIQHAGMFFRRERATTVWPSWTDGQYYRGLNRDLPAANRRRRVPAVSGACLMIARELYQRLGGLSIEYLQGYFEDSDLALRVAAAGYDNWYVPDVEMYHLEGQSYSSDLGMRASYWRYNAWLQTNKWGEQIEQIMAEA